MTTSNSCDYGHEGKATRLDIGGHAGIFLCREHWATEMRWRKVRNQELEPQNQYDIIPYPATTKGMENMTKEEGHQIIKEILAEAENIKP